MTAGPQAVAATSPRRTPVLVADVHALGMLGVLRSLGRAGFVTHAYSSVPDALGLHSRFVRHPVHAPPYSDPGFADWMRSYLEAHAIQAVVPTEALLLAVRNRLEEFRPWLPLLPAAPVLYRCLSKWDVLRSFADTPPQDPVRRNLPPTLCYGAGHTPVADELASLALPLWIKADAVYARGAAQGLVRRVDSVDMAMRAVSAALETHERVLVQGNSSAPQQAGVNLLVQDGRPLLESMMLSLHDNPHTGGTSGLRRSWWHDAMRDDAIGRVRHLGWNGAAMLEYKWDPVRDTFEFIEINARFWAALHLDLYAGADFPLRLVQAHLGAPTQAAARGRTGITSRWALPTDWGHMLSKVRDRSLPASARLLAPLAFAALFLHPGVRDDLRFPGDAGLYWRQLRRFLAHSLGLHR